MENKDKVLAAFLVSVGIFSAAQAVQYVGTLSKKEKASLFSVSSNKSHQIYLCSGTEEYAQNGTQKSA
jgi:hypothetical protein